MPFYVYKDIETGEKIELMMGIKEMMRRQRKDGTIVHDGRVYRRSVAAEHGSFRSAPGNWPMKSDAAGVHPSQVKAAWDESVGMGVPTNFDSDTGQAIFESRSHRKAFLKAKGMYDRSGGYGD
jgi:hypothetical protein